MDREKQCFDEYSYRSKRRLIYFVPRVAKNKIRTFFYKNKIKTCILYFALGITQNYKKNDDLHFAQTKCVCTG